MNWFHAKCQAISKPAINAAKKWHGTLVWICDTCYKSLKEVPPSPSSGPLPNNNVQLQDMVNKLERIVRHNAKALEDLIQNQEKIFVGQCKLVDKISSTTSSEVQQKTYAEAIKGIGEEVVEKVYKKIERMPAVAVPTKRSNEEIAVLLDEIQDKEWWKLNVVVHNMKEADGPTHAVRAERDGAEFRAMVKEGLKMMVKTSKTFRVGKREDGKPRLLIVTLANLEDKMEILRSTATLRNSDWNRVYITPDLTWKEREKGRQLRAELTRRREAGEDNIHIRQGRIVPIPKVNQQPQTQSSQAIGNHHSASGSDSHGQKETANNNPGVDRQAQSSPVTKHDIHTKGRGESQVPTQPISQDESEERQTARSGDAGTGAHVVSTQVTAPSPQQNTNTQGTSPPSSILPVPGGRQDGAVASLTSSHQC